MSRRSATAWSGARCLLRAGALFSVCGMAAAGSSCSGRPGPQVGGETHWLAACAEDQECGNTGLICRCGTCTRVCSSDTACGAANQAACFQANSPLLLQRCEDLSSSPAVGLCLQRCNHAAECGGTRACVQGACVPSSQSDARAQPASTQPSQGQDTPPIQDFDAVDASVSWTQPVLVPALQPVITGGDDRILGTWLERDCTLAGPRYALGCMRLEIVRSAEGVVNGTLSFEPLAGTENQPGTFVGPFQPPTDPAQGYPTELAFEDYSSLRLNPPSRVPFRMIDGLLANDRLTFSWSVIDVWHSWCQLQQPYLWQVDERQYYFCVPQDEAAQSTIPEGKIVLCTSAAFMPSCGNDQGRETPCVCTGTSVDARCSPAYCQCDSQGCDADLRFWHMRMALTLAGEQLVGTEADNGAFLPMALERVGR